MLRVYRANAHRNTLISGKWSDLAFKSTYSRPDVSRGLDRKQ